MPRMRDPGPSVMDKGLYEALREEGNSKSKSARIANAAANTSRKAMGTKGGKSESYEEWTKDALTKRARQLDISGRSKMSKRQLISAIRNS